MVYEFLRLMRDVFVALGRWAWRGVRYIVRKIKEVG